MAFTLTSHTSRFLALKQIHQRFGLPLVSSISTTSRERKKRGFHVSSTSLQANTSVPKQFNLSFDEYQKLKRSIRTKQRIAGIPFAFCGMTAASLTMAYMYPDMFDATPENVQLILGLDPLVFSGVSGVVAAGVGYVVGINAFKLFWKTMNKQAAHDFQERDVDFLKRLDQYRFGADSKFEDDYYGETIKSLSDYRQWVRTHKRKKEMHDKFEVSKQQKEISNT